jgi:hypothetical protein
MTADTPSVCADAALTGARLEALPAFYAKVPAILLRDPLAELLGAAAGGILRYGYADAVRLAGHSCPTVASAYWLTHRALGLLYPNELPVRGQVEVSLPDPASAGTTGVVGAIASLLTGAAGEGGFHGLAGQHVRRGLLQFAVAEATALCFRRTDTGTRVQADAHLKHVAGDPRTMPLLQRCLAGQASSDERAEFGRLWQQRVERILLKHAHDDAVFRLSRLES